MAGIVSALKQLTTKKGEPMVFLRLEDPTGSGAPRWSSSDAVPIRPRAERPDHGCRARVKGRIDHKQQGETKLIALALSSFEADAERRDVRLRLDARPAGAGVIGELARSFGSSRRGARRRRPRDVDGRPHVPARLGVPRAAGVGLLRRGEGAARRGVGGIGLRGTTQLGRAAPTGKVQKSVLRERDWAGREKRVRLVDHQA